MWPRLCPCPDYQTSPAELPSGKLPAAQMPGCYYITEKDIHSLHHGAVVPNSDQKAFSADGFFSFLTFFGFFPSCKTFDKTPSHMCHYELAMTKYIEVSELAYQHHQREQSKKYQNFLVRLTLVSEDYAHLYFRI